MPGPRLSRNFTVMHPTLMTIYANARSEALRDTAAKRRRSSRSRASRTFTLHLPRFGARVARV
jgi:hypothetical protein